MSVCLCLSIYSHNSKTTHPNFTKFFVYVAYDHLLAALRISVVSVLWMTPFFHTMAPLVYSHAAIEYDKHNSRNSHKIFLNDKDQQVLIVSCAPGRSLLCAIALFA